MNNRLRIGTRGSALALWQARWVQTLLNTIGVKSELVPIDATGDKELQKPLYEMGVQGIFTKELDHALLAKKVDLAVHSMKDVPTQLPEGIATVFVPKRGPHADVFLARNPNWEEEKSVIATSSLRRAAQWRYAYPNHQITDIRGNVPTRLKKLNEGSFDGTIMAQAGLVRLDMLPKNALVLDWMVPAPAQGAVLVTGLAANKKLLEQLKKLNHTETESCVREERSFLRTLEGGCTAPIGAYAFIENNRLYFKGCVSQKDGSKQLLFEEDFPLDKKEIGKHAAMKLLKLGAKQLIDG
jgi:hydroxymethylbilane synthase